MTDAEIKLKAYQVAFDKMVAGERVSQVTVEGETVRFADVSLKELADELKKARLAVIAEQKAAKSKLVYWGYGGRE